MELNVNQFKKDYLRRLKAKSGRPLEESTVWDQYHALGSLIKEYMTDDWVGTSIAYNKLDTRQVFYFSMEFLTGKLLSDYMHAMGVYEVVEQGLTDLGLSLETISEAERDQGLGNGGLGRLAACFMDSMASVGIPGHGIGIRFNFGLFEQKIINGYQVEFPDRWLENRNVWEVKMPDKAVEVHFGGSVRQDYIGGRNVFFLENTEVVMAVPYDTPIPGYNNGIVNTLRLYSAEAKSPDFDLAGFSRGEYNRVFSEKYAVEAISQVLYPDDAYENGRLLRLKQEYFFVSAGLQGIMRSFKRSGLPIRDFHKYNAIHINDTHPALAIPELMRLLMDIEELDWDEAWKVTTQTISYTNHTLLHEAMEKWPVDVMKNLLPRIFMIIEEIDRRFNQITERLYHQVDPNRSRQMAIIGDGQVRMAHLCIVGSHSVNGVAKLHSELLAKKELKLFNEFYAGKFNNKTNGITHRRWLLHANPRLSAHITDAISDEWIKEPESLGRLMKYHSDPAYLEKLMEIKRANKVDFSNYLHKTSGISVDPDSIFDIQIKRLHEYKRQTLNILHIMSMYLRLKEDPDLDLIHRTFLYGAKAATGYQTAKQTIKLINTVGELINSDKDVNQKLKVVFVENYGVTVAEHIIPSADISEQISTASKEASGTGNMKLMMNGAVTVATLDGANIEILEAVGKDNIFLFGLTAEEVYKYTETHSYNAREVYQRNPLLKRAVDMMTDGTLNASPEEFYLIRSALLDHNDAFFVLKDFESYAAIQKKACEAYRDKKRWSAMSLVNIAKSGIFSSDRTIRDYNRDIWKAPVFETLKGSQ